jgi:hypothetical protein
MMTLEHEPQAVNSDAACDLNSQVPSAIFPVVPGNGGHPLDEAPLPFWLTGTCPAWCTGLPHTNGDTDGMRVHHSGGYAVFLMLEPGGELYDSSDPDVTGYSAKAIDVMMRQHYRDAEPHLHFIFACDDEPRLTLAEGAELAAVLTDAVGHAADLADETADRPFWLPGPCPAWCTAKHDDGDDPDDRLHVGKYCWVTQTMADPFVAVPTEAPDGPKANWQPAQFGVVLERGWRESEARVVIQYADDKYVELTLTEARELAAAVNELLAAARPAAGGNPF